MNMNTTGPQHKLLYRIIASIARLQISYRVRTERNPFLFIAFFSISAGIVALGILTAAAYVTRLPLVFAPLGASAFLMFYYPLSPRSCPRNVVLSHMIALIAGLFSLILFNEIFPKSNILNPWIMSEPRVAANALAMGLATAGMLLLRCAHAPAAATALIASTGFIVNMNHVFGYVAAVILLVIEAQLLNRVLGGLPYPLWRYDPRVAEDYGELADRSAESAKFWNLQYRRTFQRH